MARPKGTRNVNVNDIVGTEVNGFLVLKYLGDRERIVKKTGAIQRDARYEVQCLKCGRVKTSLRYEIGKTGCRDCGRALLSQAQKGRKASEETKQKQASTRRNSDKTHAVSGLKYYYTQINKTNGKMIHKCHVGATSSDGKRIDYNIYSGVSEEKARTAAIKVQEIISEQGIEAFVEWYKENKGRI